MSPCEPTALTVLRVLHDQHSIIVSLTACTADAQLQRQACDLSVARAASDDVEALLDKWNLDGGTTVAESMAAMGVLNHVVGAEKAAADIEKFQSGFNEVVRARDGKGMAHHAGIFYAGSESTFRDVTKDISGSPLVDAAAAAAPSLQGARDKASIVAVIRNEHRRDPATLAYTRQSVSPNGMYAGAQDKIRAELANRLGKTPPEITDGEVAKEYLRHKHHGSAQRGFLLRRAHKPDRLKATGCHNACPASFDDDYAWAMTLPLADAVGLCACLDTNEKRTGVVMDRVTRCIVWTTAMRDELAELVARYGKRWVTIAEHFHDGSIKPKTLSKYWQRRR
jgi:hypothetical protein